MEICRNRFEVEVVSPLERAEDKLHPDRCCTGTPGEHDCQPFNCHHPWIEGVTTRSEKMWLWEDYARDKYNNPHIPGHKLGKQIMGAVLVCLAVLR